MPRPFIAPFAIRPHRNLHRRIASIRCRMRTGRAHLGSARGRVDNGPQFVGACGPVAVDAVSGRRCREERIAMKMEEVAAAHMRRLGENVYPGRGIVLGLTPDERHLVQVYWIMGRSPASRNRVLLREGESVKSESLNAALVPNPALVIYYAVRRVGNCHVVSNGDQTETIVDALERGQRFEDALRTREFEPDVPHYTPRISGLIDAADPRSGYRLAILKSLGHNPAHCMRHFYTYERAYPGLGHCITTYAGDGHPLPSFEGEPWPVQTFDAPEETAERYWRLLHADRRVGLMVKFIDVRTGGSSIHIVNRQEAGA